MITALIAGLAAVITAAVSGYYAHRHFNKTAPADAAARITEAAVELLAPYQAQVASLSERLDAAEARQRETDVELEQTKIKLGDVKVALHASARRVDALTRQVRALGHEPASS